MRTWLALIVLTAVCSLNSYAAGELSNRRAPGFSLPDVNGRQRDLQDYRGKLVLLTIMRTDCPHCTAFSKVLAKAERQYKGRVQVIGVVNSPPDNQSTVRNYLAKNGLSQLILFDCGQMAMSYLKLTPQNPTFDVPHLFVIDQEGQIREDYGYNALDKGIFEGESLFSIIEKYLEEERVEAFPRVGASTAGF